MNVFLKVGHGPVIPDMTSVIIPPDGSIPYLYIFLLTSSLISAGVSLGKILTKGKKPVMKKFLSFKYAKACVMVISKLIVQGYFLSGTLTAVMFIFLLKVLSTRLNFLLNFFLHSSNTLLTPHMTLRPIVSLRSNGGMAYVYHTGKEMTFSAMKFHLDPKLDFLICFFLYYSFFIFHQLSTQLS